MYLFKTSGKTYRNVIKFNKHASVGKPKDWQKGEIVLVSKNKKDLDLGEKQISYLMEIKYIRLLDSGEADKYWPGYGGKFKWLVDCDNGRPISTPFNLKDVIREKAKRYANIRPVKLDSDDEELVVRFIEKASSK